MPIYRAWVGMHRRCYDPSCLDYRYYGAKGITVCERWHSIYAFLEDMGHPPGGMTIERVKGDRGYEPGNCVWAPMEVQNENTRRNRLITWEGRTQIIKAWAEELDLDPRRISERLRRGWSVEQALTTPTPQPFAAARAEHMERAKRAWARNGRRYAKASRERRAAG